METSIIGSKLSGSIIVAIIAFTLAVSAIPSISADEYLDSATTSPGDVWFSPYSKSVAEGTSVSIEVHFNSGDQKLGAYSYTVTYDSSVLSVDTSQGNNGVTAGSDGGSLMVVNANTPGALIINGIDIHGTGPGSNLHLSTIHFTAISTGTSVLHINIETLADVESFTYIPIGTPRGINGSIIVTAGDTMETSLEISPLNFNSSSGQSSAIVAILFDEDGNRVPGKTITWDATGGILSSTTSTTNSQGEVSVTYIAPTVVMQTSTIITASFAGDSEYSASNAISRGTILLPQVASSLENIEQALTRLEIAVDALTQELNAFRDAISEGRVGASISIETDTSGHRVRREFQHDVQVNVKNVQVRNRIELEVSSDADNGRTIVINVDNNVLDFENVTIYFDNVEINQASDYEDVLNPNNDSGEAEYLLLKGANGAQVAVSIPSFSTHSIAIAQLASIPGLGGIPLWALIGAIIGVAIALMAAVWLGLSRARGDTTSILIENDLPDMRISEVEVVREIRNLQVFTLPELMQKTGATKTLAWRTVQKLMKKGLVQATGEVQAPTAGRGKPSTIYQYVGE